MITEGITLRTWTPTGMQAKTVTLTTPGRRPLPSDNALRTLTTMLGRARRLTPPATIFGIDELTGALEADRATMMAACVELSESSLQIVMKPTVENVTWEIQPILCRMTVDTAKGELQATFAGIIYEAALDAFNWAQIGQALTRHSPFRGWPEFDASKTA